MKNQTLPNDIRARLRELLDLLGTEGASRTLDVPVLTLRRAAAGDPVRHCTVTAIRLGLERRSPTR